MPGFMQDGNNPMAAAISSLMASNGGNFGGGFSRGPQMGMTGINNPGAAFGRPMNPVGGGGLSQILQSLMGAGNPLARSGMGGQEQSGRGFMGNVGGDMSGMGGMDPNMLLMHLMSGGSLASLQQMMAGQGGAAGQPGVMGAVSQMNPMGGFGRMMAR